MSFLSLKPVVHKGQPNTCWPYKGYIKGPWQKGFLVLSNKEADKTILPSPLEIAICEIFRTLTVSEFKI